ncbi:MAG TPA: hypothetical protein VHB72_03100 [Candidatus Saccharimonadales bacterium]|nr:hypothetical protein [Candidatus Saccharimonadales bacterium]
MRSPGRYTGRYNSAILTSHQSERNPQGTGLRWRALAAVGSLAAVAAIAFGVGRDIQEYHDTGHTAEVNFNPLTWVEVPVAKSILNIEGDVTHNPPLIERGSHDRS